MVEPRVAPRTMVLRRPNSSCLRLASVLLASAAMLLALPGHASGHASLADSTPGSEQVLDDPPTEVVLEFSAPVVAGAGSVQVFAPDEARVEQGSPEVEGTRVEQRIDADEHGTYGVAYRVSSEDGHVITGVLTFDVVDSSHGGTDAEAASREAARVDPTLQFAFSAARLVEILALLVAAGSALFACVVAPGWRPRLLVGSLATLLIAYAVGFVLNAAIVRGTGVLDALSVEALRATADTPFALSLSIRAIVALVALAPALLLVHGPPLGNVARGSVAIVFLGLAASLSFTGHAVTTEPTWLRMPLDMVHVAAASIWIGGLVQLAYLARFATAHLTAIARFSRIAFTCVVGLLATGAFATWAELGLRPQELLDSQYGRLVLGKLVLYLGTLPLAWNNMGAFVPQLEHRPDDAPRMLRQYVWREVALLVLILGLTAWLIATPQPS